MLSINYEFSLKLVYNSYQHFNYLVLHELVHINEFFYNWLTYFTCETSNNYKCGRSNVKVLMVLTSRPQNLNDYLIRFLKIHDQGGLESYVK